MKTRGKSEETSMLFAHYATRVRAVRDRLPSRLGVNRCLPQLAGIAG